MLKLATESDIGQILEYCKNDLIGTKIGCYCLAYGFDRDMLSTWLLTDVEGRLTGIISKFYDSLSVMLSVGEDEDEACEFIEMLGYKSLICSLDTAQLLKLSDYEIKKSYIFSGEAENYGCDNLGEEYYKDLYSLICKNIPGSFSEDNTAYLAFLSDFTFRKRRSLARCIGMAEKGRVLSGLITAAETKDAALLSGVVTDKELQKNGLGRKTVLSAVYKLMSLDKKVFVIALNASAEGFYEHIGFDFNEYICQIERKNDV